MTVKRVGIVGSGIMGSGVAEVAAKAGYEVVLRSRQQQTAERMIASLEKSLAKQVDRGKLEEMPCDALLRWLGSGIELWDSDSSAAAGDAMPPQSPELQLYRSCLDGVLEIVVALPERAAPRDLPELASAGLPPRPGHTSPVYRPPLAG